MSQQLLPRQNCSAFFYSLLLTTTVLTTTSFAAIFTVTNTADSGAGSLRDAINQANLAGAGVHNINFTPGAAGTISLNAPLPLISNNMIIDGSGSGGTTIDGQSARRAFFIGGGSLLPTLTTVTIQNLSIANTLSTGGSGTGGSIGGGGGLGAGGAIFINENSGTVTLKNLTITNSSARGGSGGANDNPGGPAGGGGFLANGGGSSFANIGGGGGGFGDGITAGEQGTGGAANSSNETNGSVSVFGTGGAGGGGAFAGGNNGGGGGGGASGAGNGQNGGYGAGGGGSGDLAGSNGGNGGNFGGGGGGANNGGAGGFGAGGGAGQAGTGGAGGFGGGGGAGGTSGGSSVNYGGTGGTVGGGGGAALGGAIFIRQNAGTVILQDSTFSGSSLTAGTGGSAVIGGGTDGNTSGTGAFLMSGTTLQVATNSNITLADDIAGAGGLTKTGTARLTLSSPSNSYTGPTTINGGTLEITGSLSSNTTVNSGTTLTGSGTVNASVVNAGGTINPGTGSSGSLAISNYSGTGNLAITAGSGGNRNYIISLNSANISNTTLNVTKAGAAVGDSFDIISGSSITGTFVSINSLGVSPGEFFTATYSPNVVTITLNFSSPVIAPTTSTASTAAVAAALNASAPFATGDFLAVINSIKALPASQQEAALNQTTGSTVTKANNIFSPVLNSYITRISNRTMRQKCSLGWTFLPQTPEDVLSTIFRSGMILPKNNRVMYLKEMTHKAFPTKGIDINTVIETGELPSTEAESRDGKLGFWAQGLKAYDKISNGNTSRSRTGGVQVGADYQLSERNLVGISFSNSITTLSSPAVNTTGHLYSNQLGLYGSYRYGPLSFIWTLSQAINEHKMARHIAFTGINRTAYSTFQSYVTTAYLEANHTTIYQGIYIKPALTLKGIRSYRVRIIETGADSLDLITNGLKGYDITPGVGLKVSKVFNWFVEKPLFLEFRAYYEYDLRRANAGSNSQFSSPTFIAANRFNVNESVLSRHTYTLAVASSLSYKKNFVFSANYTATIREHQLSQAVVAGVRYIW
jgi:uncharacterized protein with beta-barrel porin domain